MLQVFLKRADLTEKYLRFFLLLYRISVWLKVPAVFHLLKKSPTHRLGNVFCNSFFYSYSKKNPRSERFINPIQDGPFRDCSRMGGAKRSAVLKICHTYPAMVKLVTLIPHLKKIQKKFCWHQHFLTENHQIVLHQEIDIDCILIHNF